MMTIGLVFPIGTGVYGEVWVIDNGTEHQIWGGIGLLVTSVILFYIWATLVIHHAISETKKHSLTKPLPTKRERRLDRAKESYPIQTTMLYAFALLGIAVLPNSSSPDTQLGIALLAIIVPLFSLAWWCEYHMDVEVPAK
jgi:hypothetical protein